MAKEMLLVACSPGRRGEGGGALGYFLDGYVLPWTPNWHPVLKKFSPQIDTAARIRPKTDTPF